MRTRHRDYTAGTTQPSTSLPEALTVKPIVSGTKRIRSCNAKSKGSKKKKKCITTGLWDLHIPTDILEVILSRLGLKDNIQASAVCKTWCESAVYVHKLPCRPWLLHPIDDWTLTGTPYLLLDPLHPSQKKHNLDFPDRRFRSGGMSYSRDGWVLSKTTLHMYTFLFNPFTKKLIFLPAGSLYHITSHLAFSAAPTSTSCVVISYDRVFKSADFLIETWRPGEATWTTHCFKSSVLRSWDKCVFSNGVFYFLSTCGCLGVFDPCEATWNLLPVKPLLFPEVDSPVFLMQHEGDIFVMCSRLNSNYVVFKLNMKQNVWEEKRDLGGLTVFASVPGSFIRACLSAEDMNRIYPSFTDFYLIYGASSPRPPRTNFSCRVAWIEPPQNYLDLL
ncbi:F-box domain-containing protein [Hirschfeldia incana]|nr:F-box domain-containing protein [Hirschfeldia incana]